MCGVSIVYVPVMINMFDKSRRVATSVTLAVLTVTMVRCMV